MDRKGYVMGGLSFLLVVPAILLVAVFMDMAHVGGESASTVLTSDTTLYAAKDIEEDIPVQGLEVLREEAEEVVKTGAPVVNSRQAVETALQKRMDLKAEEYYNSTGLRVNCTILNVNTASDPFEVEVNSTICVEKDNVKHRETVNQNISIKDADSRIPDPLPFIKCKNHGGVTNTTDRILYGSSLVNYLNARNISNATAYENATGPLFIKKCPYDPYDYHGTSQNYIALKNCLENGYFHESSDGACFLCRLEGKSTCYHYGFETFIKPAPSLDGTLTFAPCSSDHVIYNDTYPGGTYRGKAIEYYFDGVNHFKLFLDNGHRLKYGLPTFSGD
jgi:hypothetical protein